MITRSATSRILIGCTATLVANALPMLAQTAQASPAASVQHGIQLVESGHCSEALPILEHGLPHVAEKTLRYHAQMALVRCAMALDQQQVAADTLFQLQHDAPGDPEVLYVETHLFSELGERAAQELQAKAP